MKEILILNYFISTVEDFVSHIFSTTPSYSILTTAVFKVNGKGRRKRREENRTEKKQEDMEMTSTTSYTVKKKKKKNQPVKRYNNLFNNHIICAI